MRKDFWKSVGFVAVGAFMATGLMQALEAASASNSDTYRQLNLFGDVFDRVRSDYVEVPDEEKLIDSAINGMLTSLDPHSSFMNAKRFKDMQQQTRGEFGGLGIEVTMENGLVKVVAPIDDTPAARAGVRANDLITHLDGDQVQGLTLNEAVDKMRGRVKTPIVLTIARPGVDEPVEIKIVRDIIRVRSVKFEAEGEKDGAKDIGYVRISSFSEQTQSGLDKAIKALRDDIGADKIKGYIIDLRNNPGGLLDQAISVSDTFMERGEVVSTRGRNSSETQRYNSQEGDATDGKPVVVLINGGSASASEIVAGALQDHKRAKVIGTRSFGKGSVQTIIPLGSQGAIRLTTARYYTPSGATIQARGIVPDITIENDLPEDLKKSAAARKARGESSLRGHLKNESGDEQSGSSAYVPADKEKDLQLKAAIDLLYGREVKARVESDTTEPATSNN